MTGWRMGYLMADASVKERLELVHQFDVVSTPSIMQKACITALDTDTSYMTEEYRRRRDYVTDRLRDMGLETETPEGAFYVFPSIRKYGMGSFEFAERLVREGAVAVTPGAAFGSDDHIRISYCCSMDDLKEGLDRLESFLITIREK
jgi:aminotransferase